MLHHQVNYVFLLFAFLLSGFSSGAMGQNDPFMQYKIKHLETFAKYTTWPEKQGNVEFIIGVASSEPYRQAIDKFYATKRIKDRPVKVVLFGVDELDFNCDLLFIPKDTPNLEKISQATRGKPILTICEETKTSTSQIRLMILDGKIAYEINPHAYTKADLEVDYYFMKVSRIFK